MDNSIKGRLLQFINIENIEKARFEKDSGLSNGFVDKVGATIRSKSLDKIRKQYPHLNIDWLLTGNGEMIITGGINIKGDNNISNSGVTGGDVIIGTNQELKVLRKRVKELEEENQQLKKDKAILQEFVTFLQNKGKG